MKLKDIANKVLHEEEEAVTDYVSSIRKIIDKHPLGIGLMLNPILHQKIEERCDLLEIPVCSIEEYLFCAKTYKDLFNFIDNLD